VRRRRRRPRRRLPGLREIYLFEKYDTPLVILRTFLAFFSRAVLGASAYDFGGDTSRAAELLAELFGRKNMPIALDDDDFDDKNKEFKALDEGDIALLKTYGLGPYTKGIRACEADIKKLNGRIQEVVGIKESDTGLAPPSQWDLVSDKQMMQEEQPLQV
jgi:hypothetical protein